MENNRKDILSCGKIIWDYMQLGHVPEKCDCIIVMGSHDLRVPEYGAELFLNGLADHLLMSGGLGNFTKGIWDRSEAEIFAEIAIGKGVPSEKMIIENLSSNTGENSIFSMKLLKDRGIRSEKLLLVHKPYMERRAYVTFLANFPNHDVLVSSPKIAFEEYPNEEIPMDKLLNIMVGDLQRIIAYPKKGFQIYQEVPPEVVDAYEKLIGYGYAEHLMKEPVA